MTFGTKFEVRYQKIEVLSKTTHEIIKSLVKMINSNIFIA